MHEHVNNLQGRRLVLPYYYFHYGYIKSADDIIAKSKLYKSLGDPMQPTENKVRSIVANMAQQVRKLPINHPFNVLSRLEEVEQTNADNVKVFIAVANARTSLDIQSLLYRLRVRLKTLWLSVHFIVAWGWRSAHLLRAFFNLFPVSQR